MTALRHLVLLIGFAAATLHAAVPWAGKLSPVNPGPFPIIKPFTGEFSFGWSNIEAATATARFTRQGDRMSVDVRGGTIGLARPLWQLDATNKTTFLIPGLRSIGFEQVEKYARRTATIQAEWRPDGVWRYRQNKPGGKDEKWKKIKVEPLRDMVTAMVFVRSQPLANGDKIGLLVYPGDTPFYAEVTVLGREPLRIAGKTIPSIKLDFRPQVIVRDDNKVYHLEPHKKFTNGTVWVSDDAYRIPLRSEVNIFIGFVYGELKSARFDDGTVLP